MAREDLSVALRQARVWVINVIGITGVFLVTYSVVAELTGSTWAVLNAIARVTSQYVTLIGTILTAASVYVRPNQRPPDAFSRYFSAPAVIVAAALALSWLVLYAPALPPHLINGFALLAISGALFRLFSD